jgi:pimeloyl-ACP methyl ester carboxylesterase
MEIARFNGEQIAYDDSHGDGEPVVLAHGFLMDRTMFAPQVATLRDSYRIIAWDARGFGDTVFDGKPFTYWDLASDCLALLDHLEIERAVIGGQSQGGFVALRVALTAPDRVRALVLVDTQAGREEPEAIPLFESLIDSWVTNGPTDELAAVVAGVLLGTPELTKAWTPRWMARSPELLEQPGRALLSRDDITSRLGEIEAPALVVHGTADASIPMERAAALAGGLPRCRGVVPIQDGTHSANLTHPGAVTDAISAFLGRLGD